MSASDAVLRRARATDSDAIADVWLRSFAAALPTVRRTHSDDDVRRWTREVMVGRQETWVICVEDEVAGLLSLDATDIDQLYLDPARRGQGLGALLVAQAKARRPEGLGLWTFQVNAPARRFYQRHGFRETALTDGSQNEEREPDVRMEWRPGDDQAP